MPRSRASNTQDDTSGGTPVAHEGPGFRRGRTNASIASGSPEDRVSLCDALDRVLEVGAVARGELLITVADVPLIEISLGVLIASVETAGLGRSHARYSQTPGVRVSPHHHTTESGRRDAF